MSKGIMIAGTGSGCGKTTITCAILAALVSLRNSTMAFKCGPDYIDPMFHKKAAGVNSRNLDVFLMGEKGVTQSLLRHAAGKDIVVIEGVMGIYDGQASGSYASSNHVSVLTGTPVILVVNPKGMALSVCAAVKGFLDFERNNICGIILNNVSEAMFHFYKQMIEERLGVCVLGFMPNIPEGQIESRHLGLVAPDEIADIKKKIDILKEYALKCIDFDRLIKIAGSAQYIDDGLISAPSENKNIKICIARDEVFCFSYEDNHDLLMEMGAEIHYFSPIHDSELPHDADGLILWGGYPELQGAKLENNISMKQSLTQAIKAGLPVYAEGGGFIYLQQRLTDLQCNSYEMLGILPGNVMMTPRLQSFGYYEITAKQDNLLCKAGEKANAHFYRRSASDCEGSSFVAEKPSGKTFPCIVAEGNILAGYQHLHFMGNPEFARNFYSACTGYKKKEGIHMHLITSPMEIEKRSLEIIDAELTGRTFDPHNINVIKRVIHTTADFDYMDNLVFSDNAVEIAKKLLLDHANIVTDTQMVKAGVNKKAIANLGCGLHCFIDAPEVAEAARATGMTRARSAVDQAAETLESPVIFVVGNAPTALIRLHELIISQSFLPDFIIAVPVGFVNVVESKELILGLDIPYIVSKGRKGGSNVAAAICNALLYDVVERPAL